MDKQANQSSFTDKALLLIALAILGAGVFGFYAYESQVATLWRALALIVVAGVCIAIVYQTSLGKRSLMMVGESRAEVRKVIWPTRPEVIQLTITVIIAVILIGIFLWLLDTLFLWLTEIITRR